MNMKSNISITLLCMLSLSGCATSTTIASLDVEKAAASDPFKIAIDYYILKQKHEGWLYTRGNQYYMSVYGSDEVFAQFEEVFLRHGMNEDEIESVRAGVPPRRGPVLALYATMGMPQSINGIGGGITQYVYEQVGKGGRRITTYYYIKDGRIFDMQFFQH